MHDKDDGTIIVQSHSRGISPTLDGRAGNLASDLSPGDAAGAARNAANGHGRRLCTTIEPEPYFDAPE
jgi:hypothetical protein